VRLFLLPLHHVYTPENLAEELDLAAKSFINSNAVVLDRDRSSLSLSRIFKWYAPDFGGSRAEGLRFIARHLDNAQDRAYIEDHAAGLKVTYQPYDWRLNQY
jgi:hypothetical protein